MTESIFQSVLLRVTCGCYGSHAVELNDLVTKDEVFDRALQLGHVKSTEYATFSEHKTVAAALRAFADRVDSLFGPRQREALLAWQAGKVATYEDLVTQFGTDEAKLELAKKEES